MVDNQIFLKKGYLIVLKKLNLYFRLNSIRQLQNGSTSMATVTDSARITSMAKKRKTKAKSEKSNMKILKE